MSGCHLRVLDVGSLLVDRLRLVGGKRRADNISPLGLGGRVDRLRNNHGGRLRLRLRLVSVLHLMVVHVGVNTTIGGVASNVDAVVVQDVGVGEGPNNVVAVVLLARFNTTIGRVAQGVDAVVVQDVGVGEDPNNVVAVVLLTFGETPVGGVASNVDAITIQETGVGEKAKHIIAVVILERPPLAEWPKALMPFLLAREAWSATPTMSFELCSLFGWGWNRGGWGWNWGCSGGNATASCSETGGCRATMGTPLIGPPVGATWARVARMAERVATESCMFCRMG